MILNPKIEAKRGGAITDVCLFILILVQEILKISLPNFVSANFFCHKLCLHASRKIENTTVNCIIIKLYNCG